MRAPAGSYRLGPGDATLTVRTGTAGPMARAGHSLTIAVADWSAQLELSEDPAASSLSLTADSASLQVVDGHGGPKPLTDGDKPKIEATINDRILKRSRIEFRSSAVREEGDGSLWIEGELTLLGASGPAAFSLAIDDDRHLSGAATIAQTAFGIEPYSAMMGALRVSDEVTIEVDGRLPA